MDLWTAIRTVARRWYVALPILAIAVLAAVTVSGRIESNYEATASVILVAPTQRFEDGAAVPFVNPFLNGGGGGARAAAKAVFRKINTAGTARRFEAQGLASDYEIFRDGDSEILDFRVVGSSPNQALESADELIAETQANLLQLQSGLGAPEDELIRVEVLDISDEAEEIDGDALRVFLAIILLGLAGAASGAILIDNLIQIRAPKPLGAGELPVRDAPPVVDLADLEAASATAELVAEAAPPRDPTPRVRPAVDRRREIVLGDDLDIALDEDPDVLDPLEVDEIEEPLMAKTKRPVAKRSGSAHSSSTKKRSTTQSQKRTSGSGNGRPRTARAGKVRPADDDPLA